MEASDRLTAPQLDLILAVQLTVAWAGETGGEPPRLGWWQSDLVDADAAGDLFSRLLPRTQLWAGLECVRAAAARVDARQRAQLSSPDAARTLFHLGFRIDEQLRDRLRDHKRHGTPPAEALGHHFAVKNKFDRTAFEAYLDQFPKAKTKVIPGAREVAAAKATTVEQVALLASAILPLAKDYPLPFVIAEVG